MKLNTSIRSKSFVGIRMFLALLVFVVSGLVWFHKTRPYHFLTVTPGVLYRSGWMTPHNEEKIIRKYGIRTVVNLCLPTEYPDRYAEEARICRENKVQLVNLPMAGNTPPSEEQTAKWLSLLNNQQKLPILVHCAQGVMRTNIMVAIYQIEFLHKGNARVLTELPMFGHELYVAKRKRLRDFILNYKHSEKPF
ncbi:MAG TPA: hypothetical protein ENH43_03105 [Phycisphaerales bacterium]|nr:hypothetical protein [Phycisphaerales bacterium]